ncbi:hypothetical protein SLEP1_g18314 [Rubroshorea leprosula]|uniref:Uncharacterized protein n=1 Tax=Rubroshorea leprosula TaxID=152421 RepID=A0AAV5J2W6_9ROSI|nr:hypothetical protein SLEP1_g18314 [Rubroshorea leprosula]
MSSEETVSVVGSEVMPLEYGGMDSESSPSSSEKTMEGMRGDEVVGVGGDSVPITVVEVEVENYEISSRVLIRLARVEERACSTPRDHWMPVYAHYLVAGLRFPIPKLLVGGSRKDKGWYYFTPKVANKNGRALFTTGPSSIKGWKETFFFVDDTEWERGDTEVEELSSWKAKRANQNKFSLNEDEEEKVGKLVRKGAEMDKFLSIAGGAAIPKKPRKKLKTSIKQVDEGGVGKEVVPNTSARAEEEVPQLKRKGWQERRALQKKKKVVEEEERGSEVPQFVPWPPPVELDPELKEFEEGAEAKNMTGARRFINATFPEVDKCHARDETLRYYGASVVKHVLESASWVNGLAQEFMESVKELSLLQRQISESEREAQEKEIRLMKEAYMELKKNVQLLVHNRMEEHISNFISSSSFDNIVSLYRLPTAIIAFTDCRKKVKAEYLEVDITKITFDGRTVFPPTFDFEFVAVEEDGAEVEEDEVEVGVEGTEVDESQPVPEVEIHSVPSDDEQSPLLDE